jgi:aspartyl-tRNA(Asn)/glutamyl-tRNA(Gln) amidotransferase subunit A
VIRWTAESIASAVQGGGLSAEEATRFYLGRIARHNPTLNALLHVDAAGALARAREVDAKRAAGARLGRLAGVPIALKDNLCTRGMPTTCASRILVRSGATGPAASLVGYKAPYDAHVVERLLAEDAVLLGKCNMDEFAMGSSNENSAFGAVKNPWDTGRAPGGSSGGSAAACAARLAPITLGSDTGGSVRQPASFCGVTAIKPTYGRVSRYGLVAFASSLDQVGPIACGVRDAAQLLSVIAGHDPRDATSANRPGEAYEQACGQPIQGLRVGVVREVDRAGNSPGVNAAFDAAIAHLAAAGAEPVEVSLPHLKYAVATYYLLANAEASSNLARFDGMRYGLRVSGADLIGTYGATRTQGFGAEVKRRIMLGTYALSAGYYEAFYLKAQKVRTLIAQDYMRAFGDCDVIATPTAPSSAFRLGEKLADPLSMYLADIYTLPVSLAGIPAISTPMGYDGEGLPVGLQLAAPAFEEQRVIRAAYVLEQALGSAASVPSGFAD